MFGVWSATWSHVGVQGPCCSWGHTNQGGLWCHLVCGDFWDELSPRALSGSMVLLQIGPVLMSMARVTTESHRNYACWNLRAVLSWLNSSLALRYLGLPLVVYCSRRAGPPLMGELRLQELTLPLHHRCERVGPGGMGLGELSLPFTWRGRSQQPTVIRSAITQPHTLGLGLFLTNTYPSMTCWSQWRD